MKILEFGPISSFWYRPGALLANCASTYDWGDCMNTLTIHPIISTPGYLPSSSVHTNTNVQMFIAVSFIIA